MRADEEIIDDYLRRLKSHLRGLPMAERERLVLEIRTHLEGRATAGALNEAIDSFGPAEKLAQGFVDDFALIKARTPKTTEEKALSVAIAALRYLGVGALGFLSLMLFMFGGGAVLIAICDIVYPRHVGVFVYDSPDGTVHGVNATAMLGEGVEPPLGIDVLGNWIILIGFGLAALLITLGVLILRHGVWRLLFGSRLIKRRNGDVEG